jgi:hypothetical protein
MSNLGPKPSRPDPFNIIAGTFFALAGLIGGCHYAAAAWEESRAYSKSQKVLKAALPTVLCREEFARHNNLPSLREIPQEVSITYEADKKLCRAQKGGAVVTQWPRP